MGRKRLSVCLAIMALLCAGCQRSGSSKEGVKVVAQIAVTYEQGGAVTSRVYTDQEKMRLILNGIRCLGQMSRTQTDPEQLHTESYSITLMHSDGSQRCYRAKADRYIRCGQAPWQQADPKRIAELNLLLHKLPGDVL